MVQILACPRMPPASKHHYAQNATSRAILKQLEFPGVSPTSNSTVLVVPGGLHWGEELLAFSFMAQPSVLRRQPLVPRDTQSDLRAESHRTLLSGLGSSQELSIPEVWAGRSAKKPFTNPSRLLPHPCYRAPAPTGIQATYIKDSPRLYFFAPLPMLST